MVSRRDVLAGVSTALVAAGTPAGAVSRPVPRQRRGVPNRFERTDWVPHYSIDVDANGQARVTVSLSGDEVPAWVRLAHLNATDVAFSAGAEAVSRHANDYEWDTTETRELEYTVQLGEIAPGSSTFGVFEDALISHVWEVLPIWNWDGHRGAAPETFRYTIEPPDGWTAVTGGTRTEGNTYEALPRNRVTDFAHELLVVGEFAVHTRTIHGTAFRVASMPTAAGEDPDDVLEQYEAAIPRYESYFGHEADAGKLCVIVPEAVEPGVGGQAFDNSCLVNEHSQLRAPGDVFMQEMASLFDRSSGPQWVKNGVRGYLNRLVTWEIGRISEDTLVGVLQNRSTRDGDPIRESANESSFHKGEAVAAALDADVRARTGGEATIGDWRGPLNDQRFIPNWFNVPREREADLMRIGRLESVGRLLELTGVDYSDFFDRYVEGQEYPMEVLGDFSIRDPNTVTFAPFEYTDVTVAPTDPAVGEPITVSFDATNVGADAGTLDLRVDVGPRFDGPSVHEHTLDAVARRSVELAPGETTTVRIEHELAQSGELAVYVNGWRAAVVTATEPTATPTPSPTAEPSPTETPTVQPTPTESSTVEPSPTASVTETDGSGFGAIAAALGLGSIAAYLLGRDEDS